MPQNKRAPEGDQHRVASDNMTMEGTGGGRASFGQPHGIADPPARTKLDIVGQGSGQQEADAQREAKRQARKE